MTLRARIQTQINLVTNTRLNKIPMMHFNNYSLLQPPFCFRQTGNNSTDQKTGRKTGAEGGEEKILVMMASMIEAEGKRE